MEDGSVQIVQLGLQFRPGQIPEHIRRDQGAEVAAGDMLAAGIPHPHPVGGALLAVFGDAAQLAVQPAEPGKEIHGGGADKIRFFDGIKAQLLGGTEGHQTVQTGVQIGDAHKIPPAAVFAEGSGQFADFSVIDVAGIDDGAR